MFGVQPAAITSATSERIRENRDRSCVSGAISTAAGPGLHRHGRIDPEHVAKERIGILLQLGEHLRYMSSTVPCREEGGLLAPLVESRLELVGAEALQQDSRAARIAAIIASL